VRVCHGPTAAGGNGGPNLIFSPVIRLDEKGADITRLIQTGRPEKGRLYAWALPETRALVGTDDMILSRRFGLAQAAF
jgi:hypothetical protein